MILQILIYAGLVELKSVTLQSMRYFILYFSPQSPPHSHPIKPSKTKRTKRQVTDLHSWLEAWNRYLCARLASYALELTKYHTMIAMFLNHHPPQHCIEYDKLFRHPQMGHHKRRHLRMDHHTMLTLLSPPNRSTIGTTYRRYN